MDEPPRAERPRALIPSSRRLRKRGRSTVEESMGWLVTPWSPLMVLWPLALNSPQVGSARRVRRFYPIGASLLLHRDQAKCLIFGLA